MSYQVYSERFFSASGAPGWHSFVVPSGKRAVLMTLVSNNVAGVEAFFQLYLGALLLYRRIPANGSTVDTSLRVVAYGGESLSVYTSTAECGVGGFGYLFDSASGYAGFDEVLADELPAGGFGADLAPAPP